MKVYVKVSSFSVTSLKFDSINLLVLGMIHAKYYPIWCSSSWEEVFL